MPGTLKLEKLTTKPASDLRQLEIQYNNLAKDVASMQNAQTSDAFLGWYGVGANSSATRFAVGSTPARLATAAMTFSIAGVPVIKAIDSVGTVFGALGTIPTGTWGLIAVDVVAAGTVTYRSAAANYTTGYPTEALAIAAMPARLTVKATAGYITILAATPGFVVGTDDLNGAAVTTLNLYPAAGVMSPQGLAYGPNGVVSLGLLNGTTHPAWTGGKNGMLIATVMARGSTDTRASTTAMTFNANGLTNVPKAADTVGTAFGALGTIPADKWGLIAVLIDGAGLKTYVAAPGLSSGYALESDAIAGLSGIYPTAGLAFVGYITIKTASGLAWITGTDALAGGTTNNEASVTNYYPTPGITLAEGESASLIASRSGAVLNSTSY